MCYKGRRTRMTRKFGIPPTELPKLQDSRFCFEFLLQLSFDKTDLAAATNGLQHGPPSRRRDKAKRVEAAGTAPIVSHRTGFSTAQKASGEGSHPHGTSPCGAEVFAE